MSSADNSTSPTTRAWENVHDEIRKALGPDRHERWFSAAEFSSGERENEIILGVPNLFIRDWIEQRYLETVETALRRGLENSELPRGCLRLRVQGSLFREFREEERAFLDREEGSPVVKAASPAPNPTQPPRTPSKGLRGLNGRLTLDNFVVGACNHVAYTAGQEVLRSPGGGYNPLFIYGGSGLGKTHLLQGLTREYFVQGERRLRYLPCEEFTNRFVRAVRERNVPRFRERLLDLKVLVLDDVQMLQRKTRTQEALLQAMDALATSGAQLILASDTRPQSIPELSSQLQGRFVSGLVCRVEAPDYTTRLAILEREATKVEVRVPHEVLHQLAEGYHRNVRELYGAFVKLVAFASLMNEPLTAARAFEILEDDVSRQTAATLSGIVTAVARRYGLTADEMLSRSRVRSISGPRQVAIYLSRALTDHSLAEIGSHFGGRNHATVNFAFRRVLSRLQKDSEFQREIEGLLGELRGNG